MDKIKIQNLEIFANHGVFLEETKLGQKFLVSAVLYTDTKAAGMTDDLTKSIHYGEVSHFITDFMKKNTYQLIESAAEQLAQAMLLTIPNLKKVLLEIKKPWAPIGLPLESVSVEIERGWHEVYLSFGSNMGDREAYIKIALDALEHIRGCRLRPGVRVTCHKTLRWRGAGGFFKWMLRIRDTSDSTGAFRGAAPDRTGGRTGTKDPLGTADTGSGYFIL